MIDLSSRIGGISLNGNSLCAVDLAAFYVLDIEGDVVGAVICNSINKSILPVGSFYILVVAEEVAISSLNGNIAGIPLTTLIFSCLLSSQYQRI